MKQATIVTGKLRNLIREKPSTIYDNYRDN
jgi:hypothetical protein